MHANSTQPDARELTRALKGKWSGRYGVAKCPAHDDRTPSLSIRPGEPWPRLKCFSGCEPGDIVAALRGLGLWPTDDRFARTDPAELARRRAEMEARDRREQLNSVAKAERYWRQAGGLHGTAAERYLLGRGLDLRPWPACLGFLGRFWRKGAGELPALIVKAQRWPGDDLAGVQVTSITTDGSKAAVEPVRLGFGVLYGAAARVTPWFAGRRLLIAEGLEDAMACAIAAPDLAAWAALGAEKVAGMEIPEGSDVLLALDGDKPGRRIAAKARRILTARGHRVAIVDLPDGSDPASRLAGDR